jgi:hypothetical protein
VAAQSSIEKDGWTPIDVMLFLVLLITAPLYDYFCHENKRGK